MSNDVVVTKGLEFFRRWQASCKGKKVARKVRLYILEVRCGRATDDGYSVRLGWNQIPQEWCEGKQWHLLDRMPGYAIFVHSTSKAQIVQEIVEEVALWALLLVTIAGALSLCLPWLLFVLQG